MTQRTALSGSSNNALDKSRRIDAIPSGSSASYVLRPVADVSGVGDGTTGWTSQAGGTATSLWDKVDDDIQQPTISSPAIDDFMVHSGAGPSTYIGKFDSTGLAANEAVTSITLWYLYKGVTNGSSGTLQAVLLRGDNTALATGPNETTGNNVQNPKWSSVVYTGSLTPGQLERLRFSMTSTNTLSSNTVYTVYAVIATTGPSGGVYDNGKHVYSDANPPVSMMQTAVVAADHPENPAAGRAVQYVGDDGLFRGKLSNGIVQQMIPATDKSKLDSNVLATPAPLGVTGAAITTTETAAYSFSVPANFFQVGTTYRIVVYGTATSTSGGTILPRLRIGTAGTTADAQVAATAATSITTATGFMVEAFFTVKTVGTSGTVIGNLTLNASTPARTAQTATVTLNTTVTNFVQITLIGGGTLPSMTVTTAFAQPFK